jgi:hypothetical protein
MLQPGVETKKTERVLALTICEVSSGGEIFILLLPQLIMM